MVHSESRSRESIDFARRQRRTANEFASDVWQWIRNRQICHQKFRREVPIHPYTVDFCCAELKLIIEVDGEHHLTPEGLEHDRIRDAYLRGLGFEILRIPGYAVIRDGSAVVEQIREFVKARMQNPSPPTPLP